MANLMQSLIQQLSSGTSANAQMPTMLERFESLMNPIQSLHWNALEKAITKKVADDIAMGKDPGQIADSVGLSNPQQQQQQPQQQFQGGIGPALMMAGAGLQGQDPSAVLKNLMAAQQMSMEEYGFKNQEIPEGFEIVGYDQKGNPMVRKIPKTEGAKIIEKAGAEAEIVSKKAIVLLDLFEGARNEAQGIFPNIGREDLSGKTSGFAAKQMGRVNKLPTVIAYQARKKAFATTIAKAAGEVRPTDEDIKRFMESLPDISLPDETNKILVNTMFLELEAQGAKNVWSKYGKKQSQTIQTFNIGGKTYQIPADKVEAFKKAKGIR